jgi:hypothetical protein
MGRRPAGSPGTESDFAARARAWVERSCADQGIPVKLQDPAVVEKVAQLLANPVVDEDHPAAASRARRR